MKTNIIGFILSSENRKKIVLTLFDYPLRQWSCTTIEETTKLSHSTVFRTVSGLRDFGVLRTTKINNKNIMYELCRESPMTKTLQNAIKSQHHSIGEAARSFVEKIKTKKIFCVLLYGSVVSGDIRPESDIDILVLIHKHDTALEKQILATASLFSSESRRLLGMNDSFLTRATRT